MRDRKIVTELSRKKLDNNFMLNNFTISHLISLIHVFRPTFPFFVLLYILLCRLSKSSNALLITGIIIKPMNVSFLKTLIYRDYTIFKFNFQFKVIWHERIILINDFMFNKKKQFLCKKLAFASDIAAVGLKRHPSLQATFYLYPSYATVFPRIKSNSPTSIRVFNVRNCIGVENQVEKT